MTRGNRAPLNYKNGRIFQSQRLSDKESSCSAGYTGDTGLIPESGRPQEEEMATLSSILAFRIPMDRGAWQATVYSVAQSRT